MSQQIQRNRERGKGEAVVQNNRPWANVFKLEKTGSKEVGLRIKEERAISNRDRKSQGRTHHEVGERKEESKKYFSLGLGGEYMG
jgi:hypothetical protein